MKAWLFVKRLFDIVISISALFFLLPLMIILSFLVYIKLGWPIFFFHDRPGQYGKIFKMIKFRSMLNSLDAEGNLLTDAERLTPFGKLFRSTSLDELPELFNVLIGDMSLVGPRPLLAAYLPLYNERQKNRHIMRPGITGWAQVNGRNAISWEEKFEYDAWYVDNWTLLLDFKIMFMTVRKVFKREGISYGQNFSTEKWTGNSEKINLLL